ncbi:MAG: TonB family protein [Ignavibacteriales bacterium]|nr:TonB family protein [Ignavibacteriales bacterium]
MKWILIAMFLLCGCATLEQTYAPDTLPQLIKQEPLPPWPFRTMGDEVTLDIKIRIGSDGSVKEVSFITPTSSKEWNTLALEKIRTWEFSPAIVNGRSIPLWIRQTIHLRFEEASYLRLAEIVCPDEQTADSVYALLGAGAPFDSLASVFSTSSSRTRGGFLGDVDLRTLPLFVRRELQKVRTDQFTSPIFLGRNYVIYKCLPASSHTRPVS